MAKPVASTPTTHVDNARREVAAGNLDEACACLAAAVDAAPHNMAAREALVRVSLLAGDSLSAIRQAEDWLIVAPKNAVAMALRAKARLSLFDVHGALHDAEAALALDPKCVDALVCLGSIRLAEAQPSNAVKELDRALELSPQDPEVLLVASAARQAAGDTETARTLLIRAGEQWPLHWETYQALAGLELAKGDYEGALVACDLGIALGGETAPLLHLLRGTALARLGANQAAESDFQACVTGNPFETHGWAGLAESALLGSGDKSRAAANARTVLELRAESGARTRAQRVIEATQIS